MVAVGEAFKFGVGDLNILEKEDGDPRSDPEITLSALSLSPGECPWVVERPFSTYGESGRAGERKFRVIVLLVSGLAEVVAVVFGLKLGV